MKIVRIVPYLDFGGVEKRMELTAKGFLEHPQHELIIIVLAGGGRIAESIQKMGFEVVFLNKNPKIPNRKLLHELIRVLRKIKPDVVHCSGSEANFHGLWAAFWAGVRVRIGEEIGFPEHDWKWRRLFWLTYLTAHRVFGISEAVKERIVKLGEILPNKVQVVYNPVEISTENHKIKGSDINSIEGEEKGDINESFHIGRKEGSFVFVTTCRLVPIKNLEKLIRIFDSLQRSSADRQLELWIVGEGPEREKLEKVIGELGLEKNVCLLGFQENVFPFLFQADSFILPSFSEGFSISLVEAMGCGLVCIATKVGGPSEIIKPDTGLLIDPNSEEDIFQKMQQIVQMPKVARQEMGKAAKKDVELRFSVKKYVNELLFNYRTA